MKPLGLMLSVLFLLPPGVDAPVMETDTPMLTPPQPWLPHALAVPVENEKNTPRINANSFIPNSSQKMVERTRRRSTRVPCARTVRRVFEPEAPARKRNLFVGGTKNVGGPEDHRCVVMRGFGPSEPGRAAVNPSRIASVLSVATSAWAEPPPTREQCLTSHGKSQESRLEGELIDGR